MLSSLRWFSFFVVARKAAPMRRFNPAFVRKRVNNSSGVLSSLGSCDRMSIVQQTGQQTCVSRLEHSVLVCLILLNDSIRGPIILEVDFGTSNGFWIAKLRSGNTRSLGWYGLCSAMSELVHGRMIPYALSDGQCSSRGSRFAVGPPGRGAALGREPRD